jgi:hypothetical protein
VYDAQVEALDDAGVAADARQHILVTNFDRLFPV